MSNQLRRKAPSPDGTISPSPRDLSRLIERRRAQKLGVELPLTTQEAAAHLGLHPKTVERMARAGEIPAHPVSGVRRRTWKFYSSELDSWLRARIGESAVPIANVG